MTNREAIENLKGCVVSYEVDEHGNPNGNVTADLTMEIINMAISALEKQEQSCDTCKHGRFGSEACINCRVGFPNHYEAEVEEES